MHLPQAAHQHSPTNNSVKANLTYYIFEGVLVGIVNGSLIQVWALTGGGGGSTNTRRTGIQTIPYMYGLRTAGTGRNINMEGQYRSGRIESHCRLIIPTSDSARVSIQKGRCQTTVLGSSFTIEGRM